MAIDAKAFTAFERAGHDRLAERYASVFTPLTSLALQPLLDAAQLGRGDRLLDVGTGPGLAAVAARSRGAVVTGVDVSPRMIALALQTHPTMDFQVAEVTALPFPDASFDAVISNFAMGHFPDPNLALAQCARVLSPGGRLAFSWWDKPVRQRVQGLFREAIAELGLSPPPELPQGHDTLRFSEAAAFIELLEAASLDDVQVTAYQTTYIFRDIEALWQAGMGGMVVTAASVAAQDAVIQAQVRECIARRAEPYRDASGLHIPISFLIGSGKRR